MSFRQLVAHKAIGLSYSISSIVIYVLLTPKRFYSSVVIGFLHLMVFQVDLTRSKVFGATLFPKRGTVLLFPKIGEPPKTSDGLVLPPIFRVGQFLAIKRSP